MPHALDYRRTGANSERSGQATLWREPTLTERIALALMEDERAAHSTRARVLPSAPRKFSWEQ